MNARVRQLVGILAAACLAATLGGCGLLASMSPTTAPNDSYRVSARFDDALNLPEGAPVKLGGVPVGKVVGITPDDYRARVEMAIDDSTPLREGTRFRLRYTTALGELYVEVTPSDSGPRLRKGAVVAAPDALTAPTVEDTLSSASLLVNGGGLGQVSTIVRELNRALDGRVDSTRGLLSQTDRFMVQVLSSTKQIDSVLRQLAGASQLLDRRQGTINRALADVRPAAKVLTENTDDLVRLLRATDRMAVSTDALVRRARSDVSTIVRELGPVLDEVLASEKPLLRTLDTTNRFTGEIARSVPTDYLNLYFLLHVDEALSTLPSGGYPGAPTLPGLPDLPLPDLPDPGLPDLPGITNDQGGLSGLLGGLAGTHRTTSEVSR